MAETLAFIDIGSNTVRLAVFQVSGQDWRLIDEEKRTMRLGSSLDEAGNMTPDAISRLVGVLHEFLLIGRADGVEHFVAAATAAIRQAHNQVEVLARLRGETGLDVTVLSGDDEARLGALGALNTLDFQDGFVVDIGGASTEVTLVRNREWVESVSLPMGAVNLTAQFLPKGEADAAQIKALEAYIDDRLAALPWLSRHPGMAMVGMGGTIRSLGKLHRSRRGYPLTLIHNYQMPAPDLQLLLPQLAGMTLSERRKADGLSKERADIIVAGAIILARLLERTRAQRLIVSGSGLREGLLFHTIVQGEIFANVLAASLRNFMAQYQVPERAALHVVALAQRLYNELAPLHGLGARERRLLEAAAFLHRVGTMINYYNWQDHTFHILVNSRLFGVSHAEQVIIAAVAAYKQGRIKNRLAPYASILPAASDRMVRCLGVLLALARSLDRSATQVVQDLTVKVKAHEVIIEIMTAADARVELQAARELVPDFTKAFDRKLVLRYGES